jgi:hypothetical protein
MIVTVEVLESGGTASEVYSNVLETELRNIALNDRKSEARCLNCGSHDYEFIPKSKIPYPQPKHPIRTGLVHQNCGGRIYAEYNTPNLNFGEKLESRYYNLEGARIHEKK